MSSSQYLPDPDPEQAAARANASIWHNPEVAKSDPYVGELLIEHLRSGTADLEGAHLQGIALPGARLREVDLSGADLRDAKLHGTDLRGADLSFTTLRRANLQKADLTNANLEGADLSLAHLGDADLSQANLRNALIDQTVLKGTDLRQADLAGARIVSFAWNRLTRFAGIIGFDDPTGSGDDDVTVRYAAPLALGDHDISASERTAVGEDPSVSMTRIWRASSDSTRASAAVEAGSGTATAAPVAPPPTSRRSPWVMVAMIAVAIAMLATTVATWALLRQSTVVAPPPVPVVERPTVPDRTPDPTPDEAIRSFRTTIAKLTAENKNLASENRALQARLVETRTDQQQITLQNRRLATRNDQLLGLQEDYDTLAKQLEQAKLRNQRLEETARILAQGVDSLKRDKADLEDTVYSQVRETHRLQELTSQVDLLKAANKTLQDQLATSRQRSGDLEQDLGDAQQALDRIHRTIRGTALESLLNREPTDAPLVAVEAGRTVTFGGDYLLSLTVDHGERSDTIDIDLVLQAPPTGSIPEMTLILYGEGGRPIRKLSAGFTDHRDGNGFASLAATVSSPQFPTAARLLLAPGLDEAPEQLTQTGP